MDFSSIIATGYRSVIIPVQTENNMWSFLEPLEFEIWILCIISIPIFIIVMAMADFVASGHIDWDNSVGFVIRTVFMEHMETMPYRKFYQKILFFVWTWSCFVIVMSFAGNLTAMITRPTLDMKIERIEDFLHQDEITLVMEGGLIGDLEFYPSNSSTRKVLEQAQILPLDHDYWPSDCFNEFTQYTHKHASYCDIQSILAILSKDFTKNGKCNWYTIEIDDTWGSHPMAMAFQVNKFFSC